MRRLDERFTQWPLLGSRRLVRISMDGRGRWMDNVFIERLWRSLKYEDIDLEGCAASAGIAQWLAFYNTRRPHQALDHRPPMAVWRERITGCLDGTAVAMTLRLDNADALPACHSRNNHRR